MLKRVQSSWALLLLATILLGPFLPYLIAPAGRIIGYEMCDNPAQFYFYNDFAGQCWRHGIVPLWNPYVMFGLPFVGEGQAAVFHPLSWLFIFLSTGTGLNWLMTSCFVLGGLFFYGYLRALRLGRVAALGGALAWAFSSIPISRLYAGHLSMLLVYTPMPAVLMLWERFRDSRRLSHLLGIALAYGAMLLGAHPQALSIFSLFFLFYVLIYGALGARSAPAARNEGRSVAWLGAAIVLGIALGAVQLLPTADFAAISFRNASSIKFSGTFSFAPENLLTLLAPRFFGFELPPATANLYWGRLLFWEMWAYIGVAPLLLATAGLMAAPRRRAVTLGACAAIFLLFSLGRFTPFFPLFYKLIPFFRIFRGTCKNIVIVQLCLVTLGAYGIEGLLNPGMKGRGRRLAVYLAGAASILLLLCLYIWFIPGHAAPGSHWRTLLTQTAEIEEGGRLDNVDSLEIVNSTAVCAGAQLLRSLLLVAALLGAVALGGVARWRWTLAPALLALILFDVYGVFRPLLKDYQEETTRYPDSLVAPFKKFPYPPRVLEPNPMPNVAMRYQYSGISGYTGNVLARFNTFISRIQNSDPSEQKSDHPFNDHTPIYDFYAFDCMIQLRDQLDKQARVLAVGDVFALSSYPNRWPRAYLGAAPRRAGSDAEALNMTLADTDGLLQSPVIQRGEGMPDAAPLAPDETVNFTSFTPNRVELDVQAARPRVLVLAEMFEKNWTARVNGEKHPVYPANYLFRAIDVPAGRSHVVFEYRLMAFYWGAALTLLALAGVVGLALYARGGRCVWSPEAAAEPGPEAAAHEKSAPPAKPAKGRPQAQAKRAGKK